MDSITTPIMAQIKFNNICMSFPDKLLFTNVNGSVSSGECLALTGPNGSGKSTMIKILARLLRQSSGEVSITLNAKNASDTAYRSAIGMIAPYLEYYNMLTGLENIALFSQLRGKAYCGRQALNLLDKVDLRSNADRLTQTYSTGMKQRLKWAVLAMADPPIWLLDEPFAYLDDYGRTLVLEMLTDAQNRQRAIVIATNDAKEAKLAQTVLTLVKSGTFIAR